MTGGGRIERAKAIRDERQCSVQEAVRLERIEFLTTQIHSATTVDDMKPILLSIIRYGNHAYPVDTYRHSC